MGWDGGGEKMRNEAEVDKQCKRELEGEVSVGRADITLICVWTSCQIHQPHVQLGNDAVIEERCVTNTILSVSVDWQMFRRCHV